MNKKQLSYEKQMRKQTNFYAQTNKQMWSKPYKHLPKTILALHKIRAWMRSTLRNWDLAPCLMTWGCEDEHHAPTTLTTSKICDFGLWVLGLQTLEH